MAETNLVIPVDEQLKQAFESAASAACANGADLIRQFMRSYAEQQPTAAKYDQWVVQQVEIALAEIEAGEFISDEEVEAEFEHRRTEARRSIGA